MMKLMQQRWVRLILMAPLGLTACVWVDLTPGGQAVRVLESKDGKNCRRIGVVTAETSSDIAGVPRDGESLNNELTRIARNHAAELGGNAIRAEGVTRPGVQRFEVFRCPSSGGR